MGGNKRAGPAEAGPTGSPPAGGVGDGTSVEARPAEAPAVDGGNGTARAARRAEAPGALPDAPPCTFCGGAETELMNAFGSQLSVATYWCRTCRSPFEFMKWRP